MKRLLLAVAVFLTMTLSVLASTPKPGSVLIFPLFDSTKGNATILTITNTNAARDIDLNTGRPRGEVRVELVYVDGESCEQTSKLLVLAPNDTYSVVASAQCLFGQGYAYARALARRKNEAIDHDYLIGRCLILEGGKSELLSVAPFTFRGAPKRQGTELDRDGDGLMDFDGLEYEAAPEWVVQPSFMAQSALFKNEMVLLPLAEPGKWIDVDFLIFNDASLRFSISANVLCWKRCPLDDLGGVFQEAFLETADPDPDEVFGVEEWESGWFKFSGYNYEGGYAVPVLGVLIERIWNGGALTLPFGEGTLKSGMLGVPGDGKSR